VSDPRDIVVIGGSAGSIEALTRLVRWLPTQLDAALFVVIHSFPVGDSLLPAILSRSGALTACEAEDGETIGCDRIYVAPRDCHLLIEPGRVKLSGGPRENGHRPAIDPLFRSAARVYTDRVVGVILSGSLDDGSRGLQVIRRHGGSTIVQEPREALFPQMPRSAIEMAEPQHVAPVEEIARLIVSHTGRMLKGGDGKQVTSAAMKRNGAEMEIDAEDIAGTPTGIASPECHGVIWAGEDEEGPEFQCRVGHAYTADEHATMIESMLLRRAPQAAQA